MNFKHHQKICCHSEQCFSLCDLIYIYIHFELENRVFLYVLIIIFLKFFLKCWNVVAVINLLLEKCRMTGWKVSFVVDSCLSNPHHKNSKSG